MLRNNLLILTVLTLILADGKCYVLLFLEHGILLEIFSFNQPMKKVFHLPLHQSKNKMAAVDADVQPLFKKTRFATLSDETLKSILKDKHLENS